MYVEFSMNKFKIFFPKMLVLAHCVVANKAIIIIMELNNFINKIVKKK